MATLLVWVVALAGCDDVFGLRTTTTAPIDYDAPADAPFSCSSPLSFKAIPVALNPAQQEPCTGFAPADDNMAMAVCGGGTNTYKLWYGPVTGLSAVGLSGIPLDGSAYPRLAPDDGYALLYRNSSSIDALSYANSVWTDTGATNLPATGTQVTTPTETTPRHVLIFDTTNSNVTEYSGDGTSWEVVDTVPYSALGLATNTYLSSAAALTGDGLHLIVVDDSTHYTYYYSREQISDPFGAPQTLAVPSAVQSWAVLGGANCARLYFADGANIEYLQQ